MSDTINNRMGDVVEERHDRGEEARESSAVQSVGTDTLFELLGNERRRHVIHFFRKHEGQVTLDALATHVAARENDCPVEEVTSLERKRVYTSLQQTHLPKMDEFGVVSFDKDAGTITPSDTFTECALHLDVASTADVPQSVVYLGLATGSLLLLALVWADVPPFGQVSSIVWDVAVVLAFGGVSAFECYVRPQFEDPLF